MSEPPTEPLSDVWRREAPHVLGALMRRYGDFDRCEDAAQEALLAAAEQWPRDGSPDNPRGWLIRVASRRLIDTLRADAARERRETAVTAAEPADALLAPAADSDASQQTGADHDDTLTLLILCCHPSLPPASQAALTLRAVAGLTTEQIAAAFLVPTSTMAQRISRAKATLRAAGGRFGDADALDLDAALPAVHQVLYLVFNEGYTRTGGADLLDVALTAEAIRLARDLRALVPQSSETAALLALMLLTGARSATRTDSRGDLIPLAEQDRSRWDRTAIAEAVTMLSDLLPHGTLGPFALQAAIAAVHAEAATWPDTDWLEITMLYRMLDRIAPGPVVTLNLAVAVGMAHGPAAGLEVTVPLQDDPAMRRHHRLHAVRAHLLEMAGRNDEAADEYAAAASLTASLPEQRYLNARLARLGALATADIRIDHQRFRADLDSVIDQGW